ncbi:MAG: SNF2-related protein [Bacteriovoracia bacterium]
MLFYTQIKKEFSQQSWKTGQNYFRLGSVRRVRLNGNRVMAEVAEDDELPCETSIVMSRGTIGTSECSCQIHSVTESHCKHVAALSIWVVERGSLLRAGVGSVSDGVSKKDLVKANPKPIQIIGIDAIPAKPVLMIRGFFSGKQFSGLTLEPGLEFKKNEAVLTEPLAKLQRQPKPGFWKNPEGKLLKASSNSIPILQSIEVPKISYIAAEAIEKLATLVNHPEKSQMRFAQNVQVTIDDRPLKLMGLHIGAKLDKTRGLTYQFGNGEITITSQQLDELSRQGRVGAHYIWVDDKLLRLSIPLASLGRYVSKSGVVAAVEKIESMAGIPDTVLHIQDDEQHPLHPLSAYRLSLELGVENFTVDPSWTEFHEWKRRFEQKKIPNLPNLSYGFDLRNYQQHGLAWLWSLYNRGLAALLADDMGLGKTHQVMAILTSIYSAKKKASKPSLVVAPTSVVAAWIQKLTRYDTRLNWHVFHGKGRVLPSKDVNLVLTTYGILQREAALRERDWHIVVLDEAQAIKNPSTISSRVARVLKAEFRIAMTGTPVENQATDLWSIMEFLLPGYLGSNVRFKRLYGSGRDIPSRAQAETLRRLVSPFLLRRTKSQVLTELPEKTEEVRPCEMTAPQKKIYNAILQSAEAARLRENIRSQTAKIDYTGILAMLTRLKQICDHPRLPDLSTKKVKSVKKLDPLDSGKWEAFEGILNEALGSELKVVVFTQYLGMIDFMSHYLTQHGIGYVELKGDTRDREGVLREFSNNPECKVFLCSLLAGGLGIDLTSASVCIHYDRWWNPAKENQATDRLHRIGQTRGVQVFKLQCPGTIEDRIASIIESKTELSGALIEESPVGFKVFSREELLSLFTEVK